MDSQSIVTITRNTAAQSASSVAAGAEQTWHRHIVTLLPIAALYLALGFYQIDDQSLWTDEVISVNRIASGEPIITRIKSQSPLYFFLLDLWGETVGMTEFALRSFSALLGLAALGLVYAIGFLLFNRRTALIATVLLATSPYFIWYAQEIRYVTLLLVTSLAMTYSFHRALTSRGSRCWWLYGVTSALALFTFLTSVFLVLAHGLYILSRAAYRPCLKRWAASQLIIVSVFALWFAARTADRLHAVVSNRPAVVSSEQVRSRETLPITDLVGTIPYTFFAFSVGFSFGPSLEELHEERSIDALINHSHTLVPVAVLFASLFLIGLSHLNRHKEAGSFLFLWLGIPILAAFAVASMTTYHVYNTRYVAQVLPAYLIVLAAGLAGIRRAPIQIALFASLLVVNGISLYNYYFDHGYARADARSAAQYLASAAKPGDLILVVGNPIALQYYYSGGVPIVSLDPSRNEPEVGEMLRQLVSRDDRLWLVEIRRWETDPNATVRAFLDGSGRRRERNEFPGIRVYSYVVSG
jgi:uncharacterized membrane protein